MRNGDQNVAVGQKASLERADAEGRLIEVEYAYRPRCRDWSESPAMQALSLRFQRESTSYRRTLKKIASYAPQLREITTAAPPLGGAADPFWLNGWLPGLDAASLYAFVASRNPPIYLEVGSGNSTKFVRRAIADHNLQTRLISIDPAPRAEIDGICDEIVRERFEDADLSIFARLSRQDVVFIDNSHRSFQNSDVTVFFMDAMSRLPKGCLLGIHDIFLPYDYPESWISRFFNEQYLLAMYLFGGAGGDKIIMPAAFVGSQRLLLRELDRLWNEPRLHGIEPYGGSFWLEKA